MVRKDLSTGEILSPLLASNRGGVLPSSQIYALETDGSNLYIGTQQGARKWDGNQATSFGQGSSWQTRPQQFFDFEIDGASLYAGTNIGLCKYTLSNLNIDDCQNVYDGMPNWATYSVGVDSTYVYGGTNSGVGLITKSNFQHDENWGKAPKRATLLLKSSATSLTSAPMVWASCATTSPRISGWCPSPKTTVCLTAATTMSPARS